MKCVSVVMIFSVNSDHPQTVDRGRQSTEQRGRLTTQGGGEKNSTEAASCFPGNILGASLKKKKTGIL